MNPILPSTYVDGFHDVDAVKKMPYTPFGKTGMNFSAFGLGGAPFSGYFYGECQRQEGFKIVDFALRSGVNFIDTAPWYGQGKSEELLGEALANIPRESYYIATKVGRYELDVPKMFDFSAKKVRESFDVSLKLLKLNYVDIIQIHDIEFASSPDIILEETLPALEEFVLEGSAKFIGITGYSLSALKYIVDRSKIKLSSILSYSRQTLFDNSLKEYIDDFVGHSLGVVSAAPVSMGLLTNQGPPSWHPANKKLIDLSKQAANICQSKGIELGKLALYGSIKSIPREKVPTCLVGVLTQKQLQENIDVIINGITEEEKVVYDEIVKIFDTLESSERNWEGVEIKKYGLNVK